MLLRFDYSKWLQGGMEMNPRERIATILFIEQLKRTKANVCQGATYKEIVLRKEIKIVNKKNTQWLHGWNLWENTRAATRHYSQSKW